MFHRLLLAQKFIYTRDHLKILDDTYRQKTIWKSSLKHSQLLEKSSETCGALRNENEGIKKSMGKREQGRDENIGEKKDYELRSICISKELICLNLTWTVIRIIPIYYTNYFIPCTNKEPGIFIASYILPNAEKISGIRTYAATLVKLIINSTSMYVLQYRHWRL